MQSPRSDNDAHARATSELARVSIPDVVCAMSTSCTASSFSTGATAVPRTTRSTATSASRSCVLENRRRTTSIIARAGRAEVAVVHEPAREARSITRRDALLGFAAAAVTTATGFPSIAFAEDESATRADEGAPVETNAGGDERPEASRQLRTQSQRKPTPSVRYKGTNWSVICPGAYERKSTEKPRRVYAQRGDCEPNCRDLQAKRTEETPLVARFGSADDSQDIAVSVRGANTLKLTFLQIKDITEFGEVAEVASLFVPPDAKVLSATSRKSLAGTPGGEVAEKGYYAYDFEFGNARVLLTAAVEAGNVYLLGCTSSKETWSEAEAGFKRASNSFRVGSEPKKEGVAEASGKMNAAAADGEVADVDVPNKEKTPAEVMNCKGPLPIFCSVNAEE